MSESGEDFVGFPNNDLDDANTQENENEEEDETRDFKKRSNWWKYFDKIVIDDAHYAKCKHCDV